MLEHEISMYNVTLNYTKFRPIENSFIERGPTVTFINFKWMGIGADGDTTAVVVVRVAV